LTFLLAQVSLPLFPLRFRLLANAQCLIARFQERFFGLGLRRFYDSLRVSLRCFDSCLRPVVVDQVAEQGAEKCCHHREQ